jgi:hypothetical protein
MRFYFVPTRLLKKFLETTRESAVEAYPFKHPGYDLHIVAILDDWWPEAKEKPQ